MQKGCPALLHAWEPAHGYSQPLESYTKPQKPVRSDCAASLPSAKLVFSHAMLVTPRDGVPTLIARVCNTRGNYLLNPEVRAVAAPRAWLLAGVHAHMVLQTPGAEARAPGRRSAWAT